MSWEPGIIPLAANFQNNTEEPLDAREVVPNLAGLLEIQFPYRGLVVFNKDGAHSYLCIHVDENISTLGLVPGGGAASETYWKKIHDDSLIDGGEF